jgi:hypothetical protein
MRSCKAGFFFSLLFLPKILWGDALDLEKSSMLYQAKKMAEESALKKHDWYSSKRPNPRNALEKASVWIKITPELLITPANQSIISYLTRFELWEELQNLSVQGIDLGPTQQSGELRQGETLVQTEIFSPISFQINPLLGSTAEIQKFVEVAQNYQSIWISSLNVDSTGRGFDFWLALQNFQDYPSLYLMKPVEEKDWKFLPSVPVGCLSAGLSLKDVDQMKNRGYLGRELEFWNFSQGYQKTSNIDVTLPILGRDGKKRRWIYMHASNPQQPLLNPLTPSFSSERLIAGSVGSLVSQGSQMIHVRSSSRWIQTKTSFLPMQEQIAYLTRSQNAFYLLDEPLPLESLQALSTYAADLSYDHFLIKGVMEALFTQKTDLLRKSYRTLSAHGLSPLQFVHTLNLPNVEKKMSLAESIADALKIKSLSEITDTEKEKIKKVHLLLLLLQAMQPGALVLSAEDLMGVFSLDCPTDGCQKQGLAYDLLGDNPNICLSRFAVPKGKSLYGPLLKQKKDPFSLTSKMKTILKARKNYQVYAADLLSVPEAKNPSLFLLVHRLPTTQNLELTAINFSSSPVTEEFEIEGIQNTSPINLLTRKKEAKDFASKKITVTLDPYEGKAILFQPKFFEN